ncbi:DUF1450 domain-containing protein [Paenibacillus ehimensis]|uniref:DUF1450 domain-containing protein n=1 Tax=Paenibacillus ehimensis TaxID=79264 RepID=A0ABT8VHC0_9BACL|nr:DUF1450 domain-containing protein [Paenibacillus ehimensis]MDO3680388.1 DUF1450 domain-containing protein [Paenibacillus ehimensis]
MATVKLCSSNELTKSEALKKIMRDASVDIVVKDCLGNCGQCYLERFVKVDQRIIVLNDEEELLDQLLQASAASAID